MRIARIHNLFLFDGLVFGVVGLVVLFHPSASAAAIPADAGDAPHLLETRQLLASAYIAAGSLLLAIGAGRLEGPLLRWACALRSFSLLCLVGVNVSQLRGGLWKPESLYAYVAVFSLMALTYLVTALRKPRGL